MLSKETSMRHFGVPDISKVTVIAVMNIRKQFDMSREKYTCGHRFLNRENREAWCLACVEDETGMNMRCIDVPLTECPFKPVEIGTGKELKPRYVE